MVVNTIQMLFSLASRAVSLYATLCFIRIILAWFPGAHYSPVGRFLSQLCDPYMNLFYRIPLRVGMFDFTPILSLGLLTVLSSILGEIAETGKLYIAGILSQLIVIIWNAAATVIFILTVLFFVRYCVAIFNKASNNYNSPWQALDSYISNLAFRIAKPLAGKKPLSYKNALLLASLVLLTSLIAAYFAMFFLLKLISLIPF